MSKITTVDEVFEFILDSNLYHRKKYGDEFKDYVPEVKWIIAKFGFSYSTMTRKFEIMRKRGLIIKEENSKNYKIVKKYKKKLKN